MIIRIVHPIPTPPFFQLDDFCTFLNAATYMHAIMHVCMCVLYSCILYMTPTKLSGTSANIIQLRM